MKKISHHSKMWCGIFCVIKTKAAAVYCKDKLRRESMKKNRTYHKKKTVIVFLGCALLLIGLMGRMVYLMVIRSDYYAKKAEELHQRERDIKAARGRILDAKGEIL